jgi:KDO2-lipid IV(A) lauroyltransferase
MVVDRRVDEGTALQFFGQPKYSTLLPAKLALKQGCALVPAQVQRLQDAHYRVTFHAPLQAADATADEREQALDMMQQLHSLFEDWIRDEPADWLCTKRIWPRRC